MFNLKEKLEEIFGGDKYKELEKKIKDLEDRIFEKKTKQMRGLKEYIYSWYVSSNWEPETLEKEIDILQDKLDAVCEYLKVDLFQTSAKDPEWKVKKGGKV